MTRAPRPLGTGRTVLFWLLAAWSLAPILLLVVVAQSGGWRFPTLLGGAPGTPAWDQVAGGWGRLAAALGTSVGLAAATGALAAVGGLALGRALAGLRGGWRALGAGAAFLPVAAPPLALGVGLQFTFLRVGMGGTGAGVLLAHLIPALGYTALFFLGVFAAYDAEVEEEARRLGASAWQTLSRVTVPLLRRPLAEAALLGFLVSWAQVPLTLLVGQGRVRTLTVEVLAWTQAGQDPLAAAGALFLTLPPLLLMAGAALAVRRAEVILP